MGLITTGDRVVVLTGTRDGLYIFEADSARQQWIRSGPMLAGYDVNHVIADLRDGAIWAAANRDEVGCIFRSTDDGQSWTQCGDPLPGDSVWHIEPGRAETPATVWAGTRPANLFRSDDLGATWNSVTSLNEHETREAWLGGGGGMNLHTIILPADKPGRIYAGISVAGLFRSDDDGATWAPVNEGIELPFTEEEFGRPMPWPSVYRCVHKVVAHPDNGDILFQQNHIGAYRSDDGGLSWSSINDGLPTMFGFPVGVGAGDNPPIFVIPEEMETVRTKRELEVWRSLDGGATWTKSSKGLPLGNHVVLREGMACDRFTPTGVYLGNRAGSVFASVDCGESFAEIAFGLPGVRSISIAYAG